jgi:hypothetical protein
MFTSGVVIRYIGWGCQSPNPWKYTIFKWEFCVPCARFRFPWLFQECIIGVKRDLSVRSHYSFQSGTALFCLHDALYFLIASVVEFSFKGSFFLIPYFYSTAWLFVLLPVFLLLYLTGLFLLIDILERTCARYSYLAFSAVSSWGSPCWVPSRNTDLCLQACCYVTLTIC